MVQNCTRREEFVSALGCSDITINPVDVRIELAALRASLLLSVDWPGDKIKTYIGMAIALSEADVRRVKLRGKETGCHPGPPSPVIGSR